MSRRTSTLRAASIATLLAMAAPALAEGKGDRAQQAIAEAQGKIDAMNRSGAAQAQPAMTARASAALRSAQEAVSAGHKEQAIADANNASRLADTALGEAAKNQQQAAAQQQADAAAAVGAAQQDAAAAAAQANSANLRANAAQQQASDAQQAAADAQVQADALRAQPAPAPTTTTVTTTDRTTSSGGTTHRRVVHHAPAHSTSAQKVTTTTVTTGQPQ